MLARAAGRSRRFLIKPTTPLPATLPAFQRRSYAKNHKPKRPFDPAEPHNSTSTYRHGPSVQRPHNTVLESPGKQAGPQAFSNRAQLILPNIAKLQEEYEAIKRSGSNGTGPSPPTTSESVPQPENTNHQDAFQSFAAKDSNTTAQSSPPSAIDPAKAQKRSLEQESAGPLPDLTQGIPSTLDSEMAYSSAKADPPNLSITETMTQSGQGGGDLPKTAYISSLERRRNKMILGFYLVILGTSTIAVIYLGRNWGTKEEELAHPDAPSGWGLVAFYNRVTARLSNTTSYYTEPAFPKLLPDTDPIWERPYTLVLSLEDMLVHSEWSREHGWRMAKRPGVDYFLRYLSQYYELVIFTSVSSMIAQPIIAKLDPYRIVMWPLFREGTKYKDGEYIKVKSPFDSDSDNVLTIL